VNTMNPYLRGDKRGQVEGVKPDKDLPAHIAALDKAFQDAVPTTVPVRLYRGISGSHVAGLTPGSEFSDKGFVSTTTDAGIAGQFGSKAQKVVRITAPAGSRVLSVARLQGEDPANSVQADELGAIDAKTGESAEREALLPRGSRFRVTGRSGKYLDVDLIPPGQEKPLDPYYNELPESGHRGTVRSKGTFTGPTGRLPAGVLRRVPGSGSQGAQRSGRAQPGPPAAGRPYPESGCDQGTGIPEGPPELGRRYG
jgi:hypothetical protein